MPYVWIVSWIYYHILVSICTSEITVDVSIVLWRHHQVLFISLFPKQVIVPKELKAEKFPHFMGREPSYHSASILGQIYDTVESFQTERQRQKGEDFVFITVAVLLSLPTPPLIHVPIKFNISELLIQLQLPYRVLSVFSRCYICEFRNFSTPLVQHR